MTTKRHKVVGWEDNRTTLHRTSLMFALRLLIALRLEIKIVVGCSAEAGLLS